MDIFGGILNGILGVGGGILKGASSISDNITQNYRQQQQLAYQYALAQQHKQEIELAIIVGGIVVLLLVLRHGTR